MRYLAQLFVAIIVAGTCAVPQMAYAGCWYEGPSWARFKVCNWETPAEDLNREFSNTVEAFSGPGECYAILAAAVAGAVVAAHTGCGYPVPNPIGAPGEICWVTASLFITAGACFYPREGDSTEISWEHELDSVSSSSILSQMPPIPEETLYSIGINHEVWGDELLILEEQISSANSVSVVYQQYILGGF